MSLTSHPIWCALYAHLYILRQQIIICPLEFASRFTGQLQAFWYHLNCSPCSIYLPLRFVFHKKILWEHHFYLGISFFNDDDNTNNTATAGANIWGLTMGQAQPLVGSYLVGPGVSNLLASLGHRGRRVVLGHTLNTLIHVTTKKSHNV